MNTNSNNTNIPAIHSQMNKNLTTTSGFQYVIVELGDKLWFGGNIQKLYIVEEFINERPFGEGVDLFRLCKESKILPISL